MREGGLRAAPPHVVCLGGGYVAIHLARVLRRRVREGRVRLTVVDRDNFQCFHGLVPEMLVGKIQPTDTLSPARRLFAPGTFVNAEIEHVDLEAKCVTVSRFLDGRRVALAYDHLVLALGSTEVLGRFPGLVEHSFRLKAYSGCLAVRNQLISMLELADIEEDPAERRRLLTFVIVGANYAGVEVAGELREFLPFVIRRHFPNVALSEVRIVLLASGDHLLPELRAFKPDLVRWAEAQLGADPTLEIRYRTRLGTATVEEAVLESGERIPTRTIISCAGMGVVPVVERLKVAKTEDGRIRADSAARVPEAENVWAGGDCAALPLPDGSLAPPLAIFAMMAGRHIGRNILRQLAARPAAPFRFSGLGDACVLGRRKAVGHLKGVPFRGFPAWVIWRIFMLIYLPSPEKKLRVLGSWIMAPFFGRDIVNLRVHQPLDLTTVIFEAGQEIIRKGEVGNSLFLIQDGEVAVLDPDVSDQEPIAVLGPGQHFGEVAVFQQRPRTATVRARSRVKLLQVRREAATALSETLEVVGATLRSRPVGVGASGSTDLSG